MASNPYVTVTRNEDQFTYQHQYDKPTSVSLDGLFRAAAFVDEQHEEIASALSFLRDSVKLHADHGKNLDEYQCGGIAAILDSIVQSVVKDREDYVVEFGTIHKMAESSCRP